MSTIITRLGKGSPLTNLELDSNFSNLNADKLEISAFNATADSWLSNKTINDLLDVQITNPSNGQSLVWNSSQGKWVNQTVSGGSGLEGSDVLFANAGTNVLDTFDAQTYTTVKYFIQVTSGNDLYSTEVTLIHNGLNVYITEYGALFTSELCTFDAEVTGGNVIFNVITNQPNTHVDYKRIALTARLQGGIIEWDYTGDLGSLSGSVDLMLESGSIDLMSDDAGLSGDLLLMSGNEDLLTASGNQDLLI